MREYFVYILANRSGDLNVGVTNDLERRPAEHREGRCTYAARHRITRLLYYEAHSSIKDAIEREKQLKPWRREKKLWLIRTLNPRLLDLSDGWDAVDTAKAGAFGFAKGWAGSRTSVTGMRSAGTDPSTPVGMTLSCGRDDRSMA